MHKNTQVKHRLDNLVVGFFNANPSLFHFFWGGCGLSAVVRS
jgi:hypothetical protein